MSADPLALEVEKHRIQLIDENAQLRADLDAAREELELARAVCEAAGQLERVGADIPRGTAGMCDLMYANENLGAALARWKEFRSRG